MPERSPRTGIGGLPDPLYASNGARPDAAHYDATVKRIGAYRWKWEVVHWPETYNGRDGRNYPALDWREGGTSLTERTAHKAVEAAIRRREREQEWDDDATHWSIPEPRRIPTGDGGTRE